MKTFLMLNTETGEQLKMSATSRALATREWVTKEVIEEPFLGRLPESGLRDIRSDLKVALAAEIDAALAGFAAAGDALDAARLGVIDALAAANGVLDAPTLAAYRVAYIELGGEEQT